MKTWRRSMVGFVAVLALPPSCARALDIGFPSFRSHPDAPAHQVEFLYDRLDRTARFYPGAMRVGSPATGPVAVSQTPARQIADFDGDSVIFRYTYSPSEWLAFQADFGLGDETNTGDQEVVLGGAVRMLLTEAEPFTLSVVADGHVVPEVSADFSGANPIGGDFTGQAEARFVEYGATLLGSMRLYEDEELSTVLYGGPRLSAMRSVFESHADFENDFFVGTTPVGSRAWIRSVAKQRTPLGIVLGLRTDWGPNWTARVETRLIEETSFSFSLGAGY